MFTLVAWQESQDEAGVEVPEAAVTDTHVTVVGDIIYVPPTNNKLLAEYVYAGSTGVASRLRSPSLRAKLLQNVFPIDITITPGKVASFAPHWYNPIPLTPGEGLEALLNANPAAAEVHTILAWLGDAAPVGVTGEIITVGVTATITSVVGAWVAGALTLGETLPRGTYALIGAAFWEADCLAVRFVPVGGIWRPGLPGIATQATYNFMDFRYGNLGSWFEFDSLTPPQIEILHAAAAAQTVTGVLDLIKR